MSQPQVKQPMENNKPESTSSQASLGYDPLSILAKVQGEHFQNMKNIAQKAGNAKEEAQADQETPKEEEGKKDEAHQKEDANSDLPTEGVKAKNESKQEEETKNEEVEKLQKRLTDSQRFVSKAGKVFSEAKKRIAELVENSILEEEDANNLLESLKIDGVSISEHSSIISQEKTALDEVSDLITKEVVEQYIDFSGEEPEEFKRKIYAFDAYYMELSKEEQNTLVKDIREQKTPQKILKKILSVGDENLKSEYGDIIKSGSPKKYAIEQKEKIKKLEAEIEKYKKQLSQYNDFDTPTAPSSHKVAVHRPEEKPANFTEYKKQQLASVLQGR